MGDGLWFWVFLETRKDSSVTMGCLNLVILRLCVSRPWLSDVEKEEVLGRSGIILNQETTAGTGQHGLSGHDLGIPQSLWRSEVIMSCASFEGTGLS